MDNATLAQIAGIVPTVSVQEPYQACFDNGVSAERFGERMVREEEFQDYYLQEYPSGIVACVEVL